MVGNGVRPTIGFLAGSAIETRQGVVVDDHPQTSVKGIYAAGDVCEGFDWNSGNRAIHAIQPVAAETGRLAALNMSGCKTLYTGSLAMNVLDSIGLISTSYGAWQGKAGGDDAQQLDASRYKYIKLQLRKTGWWRNHAWHYGTRRRFTRSYSKQDSAWRVKQRRSETPAGSWRLIWRKPSSSRGDR